MSFHDVAYLFLLHILRKFLFNIFRRITLNGFYTGVSSTIEVGCKFSGSSPLADSVTVSQG